MGLGMRRGPLGFLGMDALRTTSEAIGMVARRRGSWFVQERSPACGRGDTARGARGSHAVA